jgi:hypothetical protein
MLNPAEIKLKAERKYWDFLKALVQAEDIFPLRIRFGKPSPTEDFGKLKGETEALVSGNFGYTIEHEQRNTRMWGLQPLPFQVRFDTEDQFLKALGKTSEVVLFKKNVLASKARVPGISNWLISYVKWVVEFGNDWDGILAVCEYFLHNPRPGLYLRQLPIPVHTKFIQERYELLNNLLIQILPKDFVNSEARTFEERFGLKSLEHVIRFRALDRSLINTLKMTDERMGLPLDRFRVFPVERVNVIITENLMNLECLPDVPNCLGIWGQGNAAELLAGVNWLNFCDVFYWGDIDEHGMHILSRLRNTYPNVQSLMMDYGTFSDLRELFGNGERTSFAPKNLIGGENAAFEAIKEAGLRLEQEKIPLEYSKMRIVEKLCPAFRESVEFKNTCG